MSYSFNLNIDQMDVLSEDTIRYQMVKTIMENSPNKSIVNFGPGTCTEVGDFVKYVVGCSKKIILVEPYGKFCED